MEKISYHALLDGIGARVAEKSKDRYVRENVPLCWVRFAVMDMIAPEIAWAMEKRHVLVLKKEDVLEIIGTCLNQSWQEQVLRQYGFMVDVERTKQALSELGAEWILNELTGEMGILVEDREQMLFFKKYEYRSLFLRMSVFNRLYAWEEELKQRGDDGRKL